VPPEHSYKHRVLLIAKVPTVVTIVCQDAAGNHERALFPLLPLRVKRQNHERVPISPIFFFGHSCYAVSQRRPNGTSPPRTKLESKQEPSCAWQAVHMAVGEIKFYC